MVSISIASLIYRSKKYADWVYESVHEFTPHLKRGEAEFFFVANDPTAELLAHLEQKGYQHVVNRNPLRTEAELFTMGYAWPEYIYRVYRGYNKAIASAAGDIVVLVNSDNYFSPDWLENLLKYLSSETIVSSKLVERMHPKYGDLFPGAFHCEFGSHPDNFDKEAFLEFCERVKTTGLQRGGAYMPCAFQKRLAVQVGLYPEGNLAGSSFNDVIATGDQVFFGKLAKAGVIHITALDSLVYHTKEGEIDETSSFESDNTAQRLALDQARVVCSKSQLSESVVLKTEDNIQYLAVGTWRVVFWRYCNIPRINFSITDGRLLSVFYKRNVNKTVILSVMIPKTLFWIIRRVWWMIRPTLHKVRRFFASRK